MPLIEVISTEIATAIFTETDIVWTHDIDETTGAAGKILLVIVGMVDAGLGLMTDCDIDGTSLTIHTTTSSEISTHIAYLIDPPDGLGTITANFDGTIASMNAVSFYLGGCDVVDPFDGTTVDTLTEATNPDHNRNEDFTTTEDDVMVIDVVNAAACVYTDHDVGTGQTKLEDVNLFGWPTVKNKFSVGFKDVATATTTNMSRDEAGSVLTGTRYTIFGMNVKPRRVMVVN